MKMACLGRCGRLGRTATMRTLEAGSGMVRRAGDSRVSGIKHGRTEKMQSLEHSDSLPGEPKP